MGNVKSISVDRAVRGACARGLLRAAETVDDHACGFFYDLDAFRSNLDALRDAFPEHWMHAMAIKTNPLAATLQLARHAGHGAECASIGEVQHALRLGFDAADIVYDSPCKTIPELKLALKAGVHLNIDNLQELERVRAVLREAPSRSVIGLRVNPLVGAGAVSALCVSTRRSMVGVVVPPEDADTDREAVIQLLADAPFVTSLHVHVGSGSMALDQMVDGAASASRLAEAVNARRGAAAPRIDVLDIGGGLPVSWGGGPQRPTFADYAAQLRARAPELFETSGTDQVGFRRVVTEFGAAMHCKFGWFGSVVELTKPTDPPAADADAADAVDADAPTAAAQIAMIHGGSDLFLRACYAPQMRAPHPISAYTACGERRRAGERGEEMVTTDVAGPLCFAGDVLVHSVPLPVLRPGSDILVLHEAGGNTLSLATAHCSRRRPPVYGYREDAAAADGLTFQQLAAGTTFEQVLAPWEEVNASRGRVESAA